MSNKKIEKNRKKIKKIKKTHFIIDFLTFVKITFTDVFLLYKNIFHWNVSKLIIFIWSILLGFLGIIPLVLIFFIYSFFGNIDMSMLINSMFNGILLYDLIANILLFLIIIIYFIIFLYSNILLIRVYEKYLNGKKLNYFKNQYFDFKKIIKFFNLSILNIFILLIPIFIFGVLIGFLILFSGGINQTNILVSSGINYFSILSLIFLFICIFIFIYLFYRIIFSYFIFIDDKKGDSVFIYIKKSIKKTNKFTSFIKFILIMLIFIILTKPFTYISNNFNTKDKYLNDYVNYLSLTEEQKKSVVEKSSYYNNLELKFNKYDIDEINMKIKYNFIYYTIFSVFNFIFLYGLFEMIYLSFYRRELK